MRGQSGRFGVGAAVVTSVVATLLVSACSAKEGGTGDSAAGGASAGTNAAGMSASGTPMADSSAMSTGGGATTNSLTVRDAAGRELGTLTLADMGGAISVSGTLRGLPPGEHGIHLHMVGECTPPFESAGGHWNPNAKKHGSKNPAGPHFGDMMNITAGSDSTATVQATATGGMLRGTDGLIDADGASVLVHATADDYKTDPSGNSGARIACGAIKG